MHVNEGEVSKLNGELMAHLSHQQMSIPLVHLYIKLKPVKQIGNNA